VLIVFVLSAEQVRKVVVVEWCIRWLVLRHPVPPLLLPQQYRTLRVQFLSRYSRICGYTLMYSRRLANLEDLFHRSDQTRVCKSLPHKISNFYPLATVLL